jgi:hypothetical protein
MESQEREKKALVDHANKKIVAAKQNYFGGSFGE